MHSTTIFKQVTLTLNPLIKADNTHFTVALSGGVDSVVLLHLVHALSKQDERVSVSAIYVNHGLSEYAQQWQDFCAQLCAKLSVSFQFACVDILPQSRTSLEAQARDARYTALDNLAAKNSIILLGQHVNDQLETFLLRLKRGSGLKGLGAMHQTRRLPSGRVCFRPLLNIKRSDIEQFADKFAISYITDDSNSDEQFDRNFLRASVVPLLSERFQGFEHCVARSVNLLQQQQALLDEYTQTDLIQCLNPDKALNIQSFKQFSDIRIANVVRAWIALFSQTMPSQKQLSQLIQQALNAKADAQLVIEFSQGQIRRHQGALYFVSNLTIMNDSEINSHRVCLNDGRILTLQQGPGVRQATENEQISVRFNCNAARIQPLNKPGSNTLKHWFKDAKVAPWLRAQIPLIFYNDELVQVVGYFISEKHKDENGVYWQCNN
ncbi:tRNA lysidine(34) synthetase TilS [Pseudoalteromonas sp. MMG010]|uniref:tRNA lysidine(34) synthetase TilS n=1 Tax=Pseudoalteromonas sp. MMG010 TaxID=2822685 RepID=UPI001B3A0FC0|nr:tRNA lysidine(34) synthetase TilS [Pseudoalteromonas sp. MMG010]MBQ4832992.1 tRNA lysidine(34) synthetase TilS [Pseudoalteromonas sp. MMG010]